MHGGLKILAEVAASRRILSSQVALELRPKQAYPVANGYTVRQRTLRRQCGPKRQRTRKQAIDEDATRCSLAGSFMVEESLE